jgi:lysophospholipase L1-like esterase
VTSAATRRLVAAVVGTPLVLGQLLTGCSPSASDATTRVLLFGDSITHGRDGDWTWRYRLWQQLQEVGERGIDFVGPADDLYSASNAYQDPLFDRDHASRWGTTLSAPAYSPGALGREYRPDVVVVELGVNDLRRDATPAEVEASMRATVEELRDAVPGVDVVVVHVPVITVPGAAELNRRFDDLAGELDSDDERVLVAPADEGFVPDPAAEGADSYDGLHPSASGERKIASSVAGALVQLGIGAPG